MTPEKAEQFLKEVIGRRMRGSNWPKHYYAIPTGKWSDKTHKDSYYWKFECINQNNEKDWYCILEGFSKCNKYGHRWEYVENFEAYLEMLDLNKREG